MDVVRAPSRYDLVLASIPVAFAVGALIEATTGLPGGVGAASGSSVALVSTGYALFVEPPV